MENKKILSTIVIIIIEFLIIVYIGREITLQINQLIEQKHKLLAYEQRDSNMFKLQGDYDKALQDKKTIEAILPGKQGLVDLINTIEKEASGSGIIIKLNFNNQSVVSETPELKYVNFGLSFKGTYFEMLNLVKKLESLSQVLIIDRVNIQSPAGIGDKINTLITIKCFVDPKF